MTFSASANDLGSLAYHLDAGRGAKFRNRFSQPTGPTPIAVDQEPSTVGPDNGENEGRQATAAAEVHHKARRKREACGHSESKASRYLVTNVAGPEKAEITRL